MIFGGLEFVAGGYLIHRHYRKKCEKERLEDNIQQRRQQSFPGANCVSRPNDCDTQAQHRPQYHQLQSPLTQQQRHAAHPHAHQQCRPHAQIPLLQQPQLSPPIHERSFTIPRRPLPEKKPQIIIIQPASLQRTDSFATISRMPIANGSRPHQFEQESSPSPYAPTNRANWLPASEHNIYGNTAFSISAPSLAAVPTSQPLTYSLDTRPEDEHTDHDDLELYAPSYSTSHYAPTMSTQLGEHDPPPPYIH